MERLTELKVGTKLQAEVLNKWIASGPNFCDSKQEGAYDIRSSIYYSRDTYKTRDIVAIGSVGFATALNSSPDKPDVWLRMEGFVEFYNKFYGLDTQPVAKSQPMSAQRTNFDNCRVVIGDLQESKAVQTKLFEAGYKWSCSGRSLQDYINQEFYINKDKEIIRGEPTRAQKSFPLITVTDILGTSQTKQAARTKIDWANLENVVFEVPDTAAQDKLLAKLYSLGYTLNGAQDPWTYSTIKFWAIRNNRAISGDDRNTYTECTLLDYKQLINTNNTPLNTKTDGKSIIVRNPYPTVSRGQRPEGRSTLGKTSRVTITVGHLRNRAINSEC